MSELAIDVRGLEKHFGAVAAVNGIDLQVKVGECFGLIGPNGAGKSTTVEMLEGLQAPTRGTIEILGHSWASHGKALRGRIGVQMQESHFLGQLTALETVRLFRSFYPRGAEPDEALGWVQLGLKRDTRVDQLSGGQRQRLALAVALAGDPELLFLDEPTTGLDPQSRRALWDVVSALNARGRTVFLTTHFLQEAERMCHRVAIVDAGRVVATGKPSELISEHAGAAVLEFRTQPELTAERLAGLPGLVMHQSHAGLTSLGVRSLPAALPVLSTLAAAHGHALADLSSRPAVLDDVFLILTGRSLREEAS